MKIRHGYNIIIIWCYIMAFYKYNKLIHYITMLLDIIAYRAISNFWRLHLAKNCIFKWVRLLFILITSYAYFNQCIDYWNGYWKTGTRLQHNLSSDSSKYEPVQLPPGTSIISRIPEHTVWSLLNVTILKPWQSHYVSEGQGL